MPKALILAVLVLLAGCQSEEAARSDDGREAKKPAPSGEKPAARPGKPLAQAGSGAEFTPEQRATMEAAWRAFVDDSPRWPLYRDDWVSIGPEATETLVENLFRAAVLASTRNFPEGYDRARKELILLGPAAVPTLTGILRRGTYWDPGREEERPLPSGLVTGVIDILVAIGAPAVTPLIHFLDHDTATVRRASAVALGRLGDPRGLPPLVAFLEGAHDWADRMIAARAVGYFGTPESVRALTKALGDPDESVVCEAARSLARLESEAAVPALTRREQKAKADGEFRVERACRAAVKTIRGDR